MGLFDGLMGNASEVKQTKADKELENVLIPNETVDLAFVLVRDLIVFTDYRLVIVDKQGMTGKKLNTKVILTKVSHASVLKLLDTLI